MPHFTLLASTLMIAVLAAVAENVSARPIGPPLHELTTGYNLTMVAEAQKAEDRGVHFERQLALHGKTDEAITLRVDPAARADIVVGERYLIVYSKVIPQPGYREVKVLDPEGPRIVTLPGRSVPAIFPDNDDLRFLFSTSHDDDTDPDQVLDALVRALGSDDERTRALAIYELFQRPDLRERGGSEALSATESVLATPELDIEQRDHLLQVALDLPGATTEAWLVDSQRQVLDESGPQLDLATFIPGLVKTAVNGLAVTGDATDVKRVTPFLRSNAPGVAKAAMNTLYSLDPTVAARAVAEALEQDDLHLEIRRAFGERLRATTEDS